MYWIYIPPILFIAGLVALVVILGKKSATLKKRKDFMPEKNLAEKLSRVEKIRNIWGVILKFLEKIIRFTRVGIRKIEIGLAGAVSQIKEKRNSKSESAASGEKSLHEMDIPEDEIAFEKNIDQLSPVKNVDMVREIDFTHEEIVVKKKPQIMPKKPEVQNIPEDKMREEALIHRIAENPRDMEAYRELGDYYLATGNIKDAKESFKMVLKLRPRDLKAKSSLREIELRMRLGS